MNRIRPEAARRRRLLTRTVPVTLLAVLSLAVGLIVGAGAGDPSAAERFAEAWERQDFAAMHEELTADAADLYPQAELERLYRAAQDTATIYRISADEAEGDGDVVRVPITLETHAFGGLAGELELAVVDDEVDWEPHMVFPELRPGERLTRRTRAPERASILARDGTPLAEGPAAARSSPLGSAALDVAGHVAEPSRARARELFARGFPAGSLAGIDGLELAFEERLAGQPSGQLLATGPEGVRVLASGSPRPGDRVRTTIDPELQQAAVTALGGRFGGVAALDARTGDVLALAGLAYSAPQPPGSTFKIVTTVAALEAREVRLDDEFPVVSSAVVGGREIANAHNELCGGTFVEAFAHSCNSVFAPLGAEIGGRRLLDAAERFGWNSPPTLFDARATKAIDPAASTIPHPIGDELDVGVSAIGQGEVLTTPLQLASVSQTIAAGGVRSPTPIVRDRELLPDAGPERVTSEDIANTLRELMVAVVESGTGTAAAIPGIRVAGKTGTAELGPKPLAPGEQVPPGVVPEQEIDAWFTAFAPADDPQLAVAVMIVNAEGDGGTVAAPIARDLLVAGLS